MAKVTVQKMTLASALELALERVRSPENMRKYGELAAGMIKLRTRLGSGVASESAEKSPLKPLKDSTKDRRKGLSRRGLLSDQTSPGKSNLTETGQLLDSLKATTVEQGKATVGPSGLRKDGKLSNEEVGVYVTKAGRAFNHLSQVEMKRLNDAISRDVRAAIKRFIKG